MNRFRIATCVVVAAFALVLVGGCASRPVARVEVNGSPGASVEGYYMRDGRRTQVQAGVPVVIEANGLTLVAVRKVNSKDAITVLAKWPLGSSTTGLPAGDDNGLILDVVHGNTTVVPAGVSMEPSGNSIMVISPYRYDGTWVFDDPATDLRREPFVQGVPEMIDTLVKDVPDAANGFRLTFSAEPFPGQQRKLTWVRAESGGNVYRMSDPPMQGWLCPAMFRYFKTAPKHLYVRADPKTM
jgi:hypothetical protein